MKDPLISVVIPSFNKVKYIQSTLDSIINQSYRNFEVIIQDGGSTDGTLEIIKKYTKKSPSLIKYTSKKDGGQLDAINKGVKKAKGEIITYINADDVYVNGAFESVAGHFKENQDALWFAGKGIVINENNIEVFAAATMYKSCLLTINSYLLILVVNYLMQPSVFLTRKAIQKYGMFTGTKFAVMEYDMWLKIGKEQMPIVINKVLAKFRLEKDTKTGSNSTKLLLEDEKIVRKYTKNKWIIFLHLLHNKFRNIIIKAV